MGSHGRDVGVVWVYRAGISFGELVTAALRQEQDGEADAALETWRIARERHPGNPNAYTQSAWFLRRARRLEDADNLLAEAAAKFPRHMDILLDRAWVAAERGDWTLAASRFREIAETHNEPRAFVGLTEALLSQRAYDEADALLAEATRRFPEDIGIARAFATCAGQADRKDQALQRWQDVHRRFPDDMSSVSGLARAMTDSGAFAEARALLAEVIARHPDDRGLLEARANLATRTEDWAGAIAGWQQLVTAFPDDVRLRNNLMGAEQGAKLAALGAGEDSAPTAAQTPPSERGRMYEIVSAFESLGDNCDFGQLQRYFQAEPLGLLRWAGTFPHEIIAAAKARFEGVGEPENMVIETWANGEYSVSDRRYNMLMHSFTFDNVVDRETFTAQQIKRGRYLRRQLLEDIEDGQKILVYKSATITEAQARELHAALRAIGPAWLLVVRLADEKNTPGTVIQAGDGLMFGFIDNFATFQTSEVSDEGVACWATICEKAYTMWKTATNPS
jgi:tetratricopeptide (TPR) repeat protein